MKKLLARIGLITIFLGLCVLLYIPRGQTIEPFGNHVLFAMVGLLLYMALGVGAIIVIVVISVLLWRIAFDD